MRGKQTGKAPESPGHEAGLARGSVFFLAEKATDVRESKRLLAVRSRWQVRDPPGPQVPQASSPRYPAGVN
ncbi:TPA: hypothetical protein DEP34_02145 [Candidatus Uhrbacteria bacterium]|nr:hypothetical protein [Candidatus Uhrbacteria bacterium]